MATKARAHRKPNKTLTPINIALTKECSNFIKNPPQVALIRFMNNLGNATQWFNLTIRMTVGLELAKVGGFSDEVVDSLAEAIAVTNAIRIRAEQSTPNAWTATPQELDALSTCVELVNDLQDVSTRRVMLAAHYKAKKDLGVM